jgi:hypothetical protein
MARSDSGRCTYRAKLEKTIRRCNSLQSQGKANRFTYGECLRCANADFTVP